MSDVSKPILKPFVAVAAGVALGIIIKLFAADIMLVSGQSMEPAIGEGERIFVSKLAYGAALPFSAGPFVRWAAPKKDDVIVYTRDGRTVVKRCAAVAGDAVEVTRYQIRTNGESYPLSEAQYRRFRGADAVPSGMIFAVGDNLEKSVDSRHYGFVSVRNILGKVLCR
jgi:signal peptidase I